MYGITVAMFTLNIMHAFDATWPNYVMFALVMIYGLRLAVFALIGEVENTSDRAQESVPVPTKIVVWLFVSVLSTAQVAPLLFTVEGEYGYYPGFCMWTGMVLCLAGLVVETLADIKKNWKPGLPISLKDLGTLVFWLGVLVSALDSLNGFVEWIISLLSFVGIVAVVFLKNRRKTGIS